ncbi:MAG: protein kinase [Candidatus Aminicenantes bacterium]|nr:protein kinase [Candidatus Aminicenantes bacterium]
MGMKCPKCDTDNPSDSKYCKECATPLPSSKEISISPTETLETPKEELTTGSVFAGRYQIIEVLGKGGMGKVYRAIDKKLNEEVALKLVKPEIASDKKTLERFSNELKIARKIAHKNVGRMYELMEEKGTHFITMEYVPGEDLKSFIKRAGPLSAGKTTFIAKQVCEGLAEAHELGVVHRDLKPQNIMIDKEGNSRIMDFGIARSLKAKGITAEGVIIGTPEYMSPEQVDAKETDQRSDIYSLGVILYEMVTGRAPFEGDTPLSVAVKQKTETPEDPRKLNSQIPEDLSNVILRCMEKDKEKRYQSAGELQTELDKIEKGIPTTERIVPKRKPITSREITVQFNLKKLFIPALAVVALVIVAVIIWQLLPKKEAIPMVPSDKPSLAIVYFENNSGDESLDNWRSGIPELLITDLSQSKYLYVLPGDRIYSILRRLALLEAKKYASEDLAKVADQGRVTYVLKGSFIKAGDNVIITATLQKPDTGEIISSTKVECRGEVEIPAKVDELTKKIKSDLNLSQEQMASDFDKEVGKITTSFPEAFKFYSEARKYQLKGDWRKSIPFLERSIAIDPEFAMAYRTMAIVYGNLGRNFEKRKYLQKALELSDRVSDRERYQIQAEFYRQSEKTYDKAIEAFNKLLELYPDDLIGNNNLGVLYRRLEEWDKAIELFEVQIKNKDESFYPYGNIAVAYRAKGLYDKAREVIENYRHNFQDIAGHRLDLALTYICQGKFDLALVEVDKAFSLNPIDWRNSFRWGDISLYEHNGNQAEKEYKKLLESKELPANDRGRRRMGNLFLLQGRFKESKNQFRQGIELAEKAEDMDWKSWHHHYLSQLYLRSGNTEGALEECNETWDTAVESDDLGWQRHALHAKGIIYLEIKSINEAKRIAGELKELIDKGLNKKAIRYYHHLTGMIELKKENFSNAIEHFKKARSLLPFQYTDGQYTDDDSHALFIDPLAFSYYKSGNLEKAREEYEKIISLTTGRILYGDIYAKSFYMLGKIYEQKGWKGKAIEHYQKFLDLWKDADPGIAEVEDAKKRATGLKSQ